MVTARETLEIEVNANTAQAESGLDRIIRLRDELAKLDDDDSSEKTMRERLKLNRRLQNELSKRRTALNRVARAQREQVGALRRTIRAMERGWRVTRRFRRGLTSLAGASRRFAALMVGSEGTMDALRKMFRETFGAAREYHNEIREITGTTTELDAQVDRLARSWLSLRVTFSDILLQNVAANDGFDSMAEKIEQLTREIADANTEAGKFARGIIDLMVGALETAAKGLVTVAVLINRVRHAWASTRGAWREFTGRSMPLEERLDRGELAELNEDIQAARLRTIAGRGVDVTAAEQELNDLLAQRRVLWDRINESTERRNRELEGITSHQQSLNDDLQTLADLWVNVENAADSTRAAIQGSIDPINANVEGTRRWQETLDNVGNWWTNFIIEGVRFQRRWDADRDREAQRAARQRMSEERARLQRMFDFWRDYHREVARAREAEEEMHKRIATHYHERALAAGEMVEEIINRMQRGYFEFVGGAQGVLTSIPGFEQTQNGLAEAMALTEQWQEAMDSAVTNVAGLWLNGLEQMGEDLGKFVMGAESAFDNLGKAIAGIMSDTLSNIGSAFAQAAVQRLITGGPFAAFAAIGGMFTLAAGLIRGLSGGRGDGGEQPTRAPDVLSTIRPEVATGAGVQNVNFNVGAVFSPEESATAVARLSQRAISTGVMSRPRNIGLAGGG